MTDGLEDSFGQGGRDEKREVKWDRERGTAADREISAGIVKVFGKSLKHRVVYGGTCSMSAESEKRAEREKLEDR